jgi:hypothetical protein
MNEPKLLSEIKYLTEPAVEEVKEIIQQLGEEDKSILQDLNLWREPAMPQVDPVRAILGKAVNRVYHKEQLRKLANRYDLKLLGTELYIGPVDPSLARAVRKWMDVSETFERIRRSWGKGSYHERQFLNNVVVLAPRELFKKEKGASTWKQIAQDPVFFYKHTDDTYEYIHHFGNDFTWKRRVTSLLEMINPFKFGRFEFGSIMGVWAISAIIACAVGGVIALPGITLSSYPSLRLFEAISIIEWLVMTGPCAHHDTRFDKQSSTSMFGPAR